MNLKSTYKKIERKIGTYKRDNDVMILGYFSARYIRERREREVNIGQEGPDKREKGPLVLTQLK